MAAQMEGMVLDLSLAKEKQQNFEAWVRQEGRSLPIEMTVQVLTTGFWPQYKVRPRNWLSLAVYVGWVSTIGAVLYHIFLCPGKEDREAAGTFTG